MKFLIDQALSPKLAEWLAANGNEARHVRDLHMSRATDQERFERASQEGEVIVTADLDFARIISLSGLDRPGIILFRGGSLSEAMQEMMATVLANVSQDVIARSAIVVTHSGIRVAPLPIRPDINKEN